MEENLEEILKDGISKIEEAKSIEELQEIRRIILGKNSAISQVLKKIGSLSLETKKEIGMKATEIKEEFTEKIKLKEKKLIESKSILDEPLDLSLPGRKINSGTLHMEYSGLYTYSSDRLSTGKGAQYYNGHKETYYSQRVLPGTSLNIPGRHVAEDGTVRDGDGFICVAADPGFMPKGSVLITSLGPAKVYDSGCAYGIIDIYVNW